MPGKKVYIPTAAQLARAAEQGWDAWIQNERDEAAVAQGCRFDTAAAIATRDFFHNHLTHGVDRFAGKPFVLEDWQWHGLVGPIYGWKNEDGTRRFRKSFTFMGKKNGKTMLAAAIAIRESLEQHGAKAFITAVAKSQAGDCFEEVAGMIDRSPALSSKFKVRLSSLRATCSELNSLITAITASGGSSQGKNASCLILDELHKWQDRAFFGSLLYATAMRINALVLMITTAGDNLTSICYEEYEKAKRVLECKDMSIDYLPLIYEAKPDARIDDLQAWKDANPNYGVTLPEANILSSVEEAKGSPQRVGDLKRYRLNIWTQPRDAWLDRKQWDSLPKLDLLDVDGMNCYAGLDLARVYDFAAFARVFDLGGGAIGLAFRLWIPAEVVDEKQATDQIPLHDWIERGFVSTTPGDSIDYGELRRQIVADHAATPIDELGFDPHNAELLANQQLGAEDGINVVAVPQVMMQMSPPSTEFERLIASGKIHHDHNPAIAWMVGNVIVYRNSNDQIRPIKKQSKGRIDGVVAALVGLNRKMGGATDRPPTFYDNNAVEWI